VTTTLGLWLALRAVLSCIGLYQLPAVGPGPRHSDTQQDPDDHDHPQPRNRGPPALRRLR